jgi:hypothetical protein
MRWQCSTSCMARWKGRFLTTVLVTAVVAGAFVSVGVRADRARAWSVASRTAGLGVPTVSCLEAIGHEKSGRADRSRVVLGVVSAAPANLWGSEPVRTHKRPWGYWQKAGLGVRMGTPTVLVRVPPAWRRRVAITYGTTAIVSALWIARCPARSAWSLYAGGFYLRAPACVPLVFQVRRRTATVWFGVGRTCPASRCLRGQVFRNDP